MEKARVVTFRETIGGVEVVDAAFADRLLNAAIKVMTRHAQWRKSQADLRKGAEPPANTAKNRVSEAKRRYRRARVECWNIVNEATGETKPDPM